MEVRLRRLSSRLCPCSLPVCPGPNDGRRCENQCDQFVHHKISEPRLIAAWLSGYYNAKRNNRVIDLQALEENMSKVSNYCSDEKNFKVPVMKAIEQVLGKSN
jgi:hypothetical protein